MVLWSDTSTITCLTALLAIAWDLGTLPAFPEQLIWVWLEMKLSVSEQEEEPRLPAPC